MNSIFLGIKLTYNLKNILLRTSFWDDILINSERLNIKKISCNKDGYISLPLNSNKFKDILPRKNELLEFIQNYCTDINIEKLPVIIISQIMFE